MEDDNEDIARNLRERLLLIGPTSTPNAEDPEIFDLNKVELMDQMRWVFGQTGHMYPTAWIFVSRDPNTGAKLETPEMGVISLVGGFRNNLEKDIWAHYLSRIAYEGQAIAIITAMESWMVELPKETKKVVGVRPSEHPERKECLWVSVEHISDLSNTQMIMAEVIREGDQARLGEFIQNPATFSGRMSGFLVSSLAQGKTVGQA